MSTFEEWEPALRRAALEGAARIRFGRTSGEDGHSVSYSMNSYDAEGGVIGDDREYELLKAVFDPLERLSEGIEGDFMLELDLARGAVARVDGR